MKVEISGQNRAKLTMYLDHDFSVEITDPDGKRILVDLPVTLGGAGGRHPLTRVALYKFQYDLGEKPKHKKLPLYAAIQDFTFGNQMTVAVAENEDVSVRIAGGPSWPESKESKEFRLPAGHSNHSQTRVNQFIALIEAMEKDNDEITGRSGSEVFQAASSRHLAKNRGRRQGRQQRTKT